MLRAKPALQDLVQTFETALQGLDSTQNPSSGRGVDCVTGCDHCRPCEPDQDPDSSSDYGSECDDEDEHLADFEVRVVMEIFDLELNHACDASCVKQTLDHVDDRVDDRLDCFLGPQRLAGFELDNGLFH